MEENGGNQWAQMKVSTWFEDAQDILESIARNINDIVEREDHIIPMDWSKNGLSDDDLNEYYS